MVLLPLVVPALGATSVHAADTNATVVVPPSVFIQPANVTEGRDPFYPESSRTSSGPATSGTTSPTNSAAATKVPDVTNLKVHAISGAPEHMLAIINNHTFAVGDDGEVLADGSRVLLRCVEISPNYVVVQISGRLHRLNLETQK